MHSDKEKNCDLSDCNITDQKMSSEELSDIENFTLSICAIVVSRTAAAPIDRVKLLLQNQVLTKFIINLCRWYFKSKLWPSWALCGSPHLALILYVSRTRWSNRANWIVPTVALSTAPSAPWEMRGSTPSGGATWSTASDPTPAWSATGPGSMSPCISPTQNLTC